MILFHSVKVYRYIKSCLYFPITRKAHYIKPEICAIDVERHKSSNPNNDQSIQLQTKRTARNSSAFRYLSCPFVFFLEDDKKTRSTTFTKRTQAEREKESRRASKFLLDMAPPRFTMLSGGFLLHSRLCFR